MKKMTIAALMGLVSLAFVGAARAEGEGDKTQTKQVGPVGNKCGTKLRGLQARVTAACKSRGKPYSCKVGRLTCQQVKARKANGIACKKARVAVQGCFDSTDEGHKTAIDNVQAAIDTCGKKQPVACRPARKTGGKGGGKQTPKTTPKQEN